MLDRAQQTISLPNGAKLTVWRKTARGKFRACVNLPTGELVATEGFRFVTFLEAVEWGKRRAELMQGTCLQEADRV